MLLYLPRFYVRDIEANIARLHSELDAAAAGCGIIVFPEQFITGYRAACEPLRLHDEFTAGSARQPELLCIFGTVTEEGRNRQWAYRDGQPLAHYDKVHLFEPNLEHELWQSGARYVALTHGGLTIGLATCNDVRFPEQARALKLQLGIQMMIYPALWPWQRDHVWRALLQARAIENGVFCIGCCVAGVDNGLERFDGAGNYVFDPLGEPVYAQGCVYNLDEQRLGAVTVDTRAQYREVTQVELVEEP